MAEIPNLPISFEADEEIRFPACERVDFERIFYNSNGVLRGGVVDSFYLVARHTVERIANGQALEDMQGVAALYLFRHYLELALKSIVYCLRRLNTGRQNCPEEDRRPVKPKHALMQFWNEIENDCPAKVGQKMWSAWDIALVDKCIAEFDSIDPTGERFRYSNEKGYGVILRWGDDFVEVRCPNGHKFQERKEHQSESAEGVFRCARCYEEEQRANEQGRRFYGGKLGEFKVRDRLNPLGISWTALLKVMGQTHNVLEEIDSYLVETYFENEEWQDEMNSW